MTYQHQIKQALYFLATTLIVIAPALYNRYPLVYFDSGAYMEMAVNLMPSVHRALGYPFLMRITGWIVSNWPIVFVQGLLVSLLCFRMVKLLLADRHYWCHFLLITVLSFSTSLSWYASQLMPDIFTFILVMSILLLLIEPQLTKSRASTYGSLIFVSLLTHLSHIPLVLLILISIGVLRLRKYKLVSMVNRLKFTTISISLVVAFLVTCTYNAVHGFGFRLSLASNVFVTANIGEMGFLKMYLDENCAQNDLSLCSLKDSLPLETGGYLWDGDGPVQQHPGGWEAANEEYAQVVHDFLLKPRYLKWLVFGAVKSTVQQMFQIELGSGLQYTYADGSAPSWPMHSHFKQELNEYLTSVQNKDASQLPLDFFKILNYISLFLSILIIAWAVLNKKLDHRFLLLLVLIGLFYFFNAGITGVLANVYERLQCRLLPLFPLLAILILMQLSPFLAEKKPSI